MTDIYTEALPLNNSYKYLPSAAPQPSTTDTGFWGKTTSFLGDFGSKVGNLAQSVFSVDAQIQDAQLARRLHQVRNDAIENIAIGQSPVLQAQFPSMQDFMNTPDESSARLGTTLATGIGVNSIATLALWGLAAFIGYSVLSK